ncbi:sel1 repeat family protein [Dyella mobilis]|uniref:Sel1 repeat family protein n=1 Tax=Dyella mobilis TaxID=1849582 RepID=A0ABS2KEW6_9GAMM|nr:sel1 repeat family protein [Dyella mobilis]MBM7128888.1 sel1 repeat family protein [Dyella mobilis]GLQ99421.1 hypothetical protein GCM10007863_38410 [Dyella mobilis]
MIRAMRHIPFFLILLAAMWVVYPATAATPLSGTCVPVLEKLLPGQFHYCVAVHDWQKGDDAAGFSEAKYAARWGEKRAQFALGVDYFNGRRGIAIDKAQGLAWLTLAAERKDPYYAAILASARSQSTPQEQAQAQALVAKMLPSYGDAQVAQYAERRFQAQWWAIRDHVWDAMQGTGLDPWSKDTAVVIDGLGTVQPILALRKLQDAGDGYFQGWGHVTVGVTIPANSPLAQASRVSASTSQTDR